ncbi:MarR family transcriptional regulator [Desulfosarcina alkanivorans]|uniref:MarR family transcriptional regulator n=1 Tax=Desulfosarcina alkanivorans TaxID=571177 RepID=A0A5K7YMT1_9BACT|nr:MarR family transcriptional regulator [Desulfosarcina alkanivorans]BBO69685.1 MarR family transcriptional regulator [Desulfosarcina alkanivorans]
MKNGDRHARTPSAEIFTALILETFRFNGQLLAAGNRLTQEFGLTSALWQVLGAIDEKPLPVAQIARNMGLTRQSVRRSAHLLKDKGFVDFQENPHHRRAKLVALTIPGRDALGQIRAIQTDWANAVADGISVQQLKSAVNTIMLLSSRL